MLIPCGQATARVTDVDQVERTVCSATLEIARRRAPDLREVTTNQALIEHLGLKSMDLAELLASLEVELGVDPFATMSIARVHTVGDLCAAYSSCLPPKG